MSDPEGTFLSRWSRRKALRQQALDDDTVAGSVDQAQQTADEPAEESAPPLTDKDMPPIESLGEDDDFSGFLSPEVSEKLRKLALRKLFHGAGYNIRDGLCEYDDDYTVFEPLGDIITSDMRHQKEMLERKAREAAEREKALVSESETETETTLEEDRVDEQAGSEGLAETAEAQGDALDDENTAMNENEDATEEGEEKNV